MVYWISMGFYETFFTAHYVAVALILGVFLAIEFFLQRLKKEKRAEYEIKKAAIESVEEIEDLSIEHYRQLQSIDSIRFIFIIVGVVSILAVFNIQALNIIAVATGALILAFRESFTSFVAYFYILSNFKLGDDIRINGALGEIVRVKPLYTSLAGKDENGEYNSKLNNVPNFMFLNQTIEQQQLKSDDYRNIMLQILYVKDNFTDPFEVWLEKLEARLDELLPKRIVTKVGHFRGYAGVKYKLHFDYNEKGEVVVRVSFIAKSNKAQDVKESIIKFIEQLKK